MKNEMLTSILNELSNLESDKCITSDELAYHLHCSKRTVLKYINELKNLSQRYGYSIISKKGKGFSFKIENDEVFKQCELLNGHKNDSPLRRKKWLFNELIYASSFRNVYDLADELFVSPSLVRKDINDLKPLISKYSLELKHSHTNGYMIIGKEKSIREALSQECADLLNESIAKGNKYTDSIALQALHEAIKNSLNSAGISTTVDAINSLSIHILIAINRIETHNIIEVGKIPARYTNNVEYKIAKSLNEKIEEIFGISLTKEELYYFSLHISGKSKNYSDRTPNGENENKESNIFYNLFLRQINKTFSIDLFSDENLRINLINHITPFLHRLKNNLQINKTNLSVIKDEFPFANELVVEGFKGIKQKWNYSITEAEQLYFVLHLALALEINKELNKYNFAVVLNNDSSVFNLISYRLSKVFEKQINIIKLFYYDDIKESDLNNFDIIINCTGKKFWFSKPIVITHEFVSDNDMYIIQEIINKLDTRDKLSKYFSKDLFFIMDESEKTVLIKKLVKKVAKVIELPRSFEKSVLERETFSSTSYNNRIAIPHPNASDDFPDFISICRLSKPIKWDDKIVQFVFLISLKSSDSTIQTFFSTLSKLILNNEKMQQLQKAKTYDDFINIFFR